MEVIRPRRRGLSISPSSERGGHDGAHPFQQNADLLAASRGERDLNGIEYRQDLRALISATGKAVGAWCSASFGGNGEVASLEGNIDVHSQYDRNAGRDTAAAAHSLTPS